MTGMSSSSRNSRGKRIITSASRRKSKKRKIVKRGTSPSHFLMSPEEELQFCSGQQMAIPGRHQMDQLQRASSALYLKPREVPSSNNFSIYVSTDYDNGEYSTLDQLKSPVRQHVQDNWRPLEIAVFESAICAFGKDFLSISRHIKTKSRSQCVEFYYEVWKHSFHYFVWKSHADMCLQLKEQEKVQLQQEVSHAQRVTLPAYFDTEPAPSKAEELITNSAQLPRITGFPFSRTALLLHAQTQHGRAILEAAGGGWSRDSSASLDCVNNESLAAIDALQRDFLQNRNYDALTSIGQSRGGNVAPGSGASPQSWAELQSRTQAGPGSIKVVSRRLSLFTPAVKRDNDLVTETATDSIMREDENRELQQQEELNTIPSTTTTNEDTENVDTGLWANLKGNAKHAGIEFRRLIRHRNSVFDNALLVDVTRRSVQVNTKPGTRGGKKSYSGKLAFDPHMNPRLVDHTEATQLRKDAFLEGPPVSRNFEVEHSKLLLELNHVSDPNFAENCLDVFSSSCPTVQLSPTELAQPSQQHLAKDTEQDLLCETCGQVFPSISNLYQHAHSVHYNESAIPNITQQIKE